MEEKLKKRLDFILFFCSPRKTSIYNLVIRACMDEMQRNQNSKVLVIFITGFILLLLSVSNKL